MKLIKLNKISNFSSEYPKWKKIMILIAFNICGLVLFPRKNLLSEKDIKSCYKNIRKGDVLLVGNLKTVFSNLINEPITHSILMVSNKTAIHSTVHGVKLIKLKEILLIYDTYVIIRIQNDSANLIVNANSDIVKKKNSELKCVDTDKVIKNAIKYAKKQLGKSYNFLFTDDSETIFCSQLIIDSFRFANYESNVKAFKNKSPIVFNKNIKIYIPFNANKPSALLKGNFELIDYSENLVIRNKKVRLNRNNLSFIKNLFPEKIKQIFNLCFKN